MIKNIFYNKILSILFAFAVSGIFLSKNANACSIPQNEKLTPVIRKKIAECLNWYYPANSCFPEAIIAPDINSTDEAIKINAQNISLNQSGKVQISGNVTIKQQDKIITTEKATIFKEQNSNHIKKIFIKNGIRYQENNKIIYAQSMQLDPKDKTGTLWHVIYRFDNPNSKNQKSAKNSWGQAKVINKDSDDNYFLEQATYSSCAPQNNSWHLEAKKIKIYSKQKKGVLEHGKFYLGNLPVFYTPFWNFPTTNERKSGFLFPTKGYSNTYGFDIALPYYLNLAPNYDATIIPHFYAERGVMIGGDLRYLSHYGMHNLYGNFLPNDPAYRQFLASNLEKNPDLLNNSTNRWAIGTNDTENFSENLILDVNYQQVSDDYYLQNFNNNLATVTERQLLQQAQLKYNDEHWIISGKLQRYQTLQPINETPILDIYQRLPQIEAVGLYNNLPINSSLKLITEYDQFVLPNTLTSRSQGPRFYLNPILTSNFNESWGYIEPSIELSQSFYSVNKNITTKERDFTFSIPRYSIDSGLFFDRPLAIFDNNFKQTLEPRLYYLYVPYKNQTEVPIYDSAYMIFNFDQLTRNNIFSGFDRISNANQLAFSLSSRFINQVTGSENLILSLGQIYYFSDRKVKLCQSILGTCTQDPLALGYIDPTAPTSPIATRATYIANNNITMQADYIWNTATRSTNNAHMDVRISKDDNKLINLGYTYMVNGNITLLNNNPLLQNSPLHQASIAYAWPYNDQWSSLGTYSYDLSQKYQMMAFLGIQYDNCCWAMRLLGGQTFASLDNNLNPEYNKSIFLQILWKGLGSLGNSNPQTIINSFLPNYKDPFH